MYNMNPMTSLAECPVDFIYNTVLIYGSEYFSIIILLLQYFFQLCFPQMHLDVVFSR